MNTITFGSLFSGGGGLDLGLEQAGLKCVFQVENDKHCLTLLKRYWPDVPKNEIRPCMGLVGGDPCPIRSSLGKLKGANRQLDMSGYFLAMVARCKPRWVLRENVCAPDVVDFSCALQVLGYHVFIVEANSEAFTGQSRNREFVTGFATKESTEKFKMVVEQEVNKESYHQNGQNQRLQQVDKTSRFKGVFWSKQLKKWCAQICLNGKSMHIGYYFDETEAACAYDAKARELFGEFAKTNFEE